MSQSSLDPLSSLWLPCNDVSNQLMTKRDNPQGLTVAVITGTAGAGGSY